MNFLPKYGLFIGLYSLTNSLVFFSIAIEKIKIFALLLIAMIVQFVALNTFHFDIAIVIRSNTYVMFSLLVAVVGYLLFTFRHAKQPTQLSV